VTALADDLHRLADLLDRDDIYDFVVDVMADARDKAPRDDNDRDSAEVLDEVIAALRAAN
jgi:hypothetical protein